MRIEERELGVPRDRVDVPAREVVIGGVDLPIFAAEIEVCVLEAHAEAVREVDGIPTRAVDQEPGAVRLVAAPDQDEDLPPRIVEDAVPAAIREVDVEAISRDVDRGHFVPQQKPRARSHGVVAEGLRERPVVHRGVRLRPDRSMATNLRFLPPDFGPTQQREFVLAHSVRKAPLQVLLETSDVRLSRGDLEGGDGKPRQAARGGVLLPHAVGDLGAPREDLPVHWVEVERSMDHTRVPARRVRGDVNLLLEDRDPSLVSIREPICD